MTEEQWVALRNYIEARIKELVNERLGAGSIEDTVTTVEREKAVRRLIPSRDFS